MIFVSSIETDAFMISRCCCIPGKQFLLGVTGSSRCPWCFKYPGFISVNIKMASNGRCGNWLMCFSNHRNNRFNSLFS